MGGIGSGIHRGKLEGRAQEEGLIQIKAANEVFFFSSLFLTGTGGSSEGNLGR